jgi:acyl carrier protein
MKADELTTLVHGFIQANFLVDRKKVLSDEDSLIRTGIVDSTGVLELIGFLEEKLGIQFEDDELVPENFDSVMRIAGFLSRKLPHTIPGTPEEKT